MKTIWVVEQGQYSDYSVVGVFSKKEDAQRICDMCNAEYGPDAYDAASIAEWSLDPSIEELNQGLTRFLVWMERDGRVERVNPSWSKYDLGTSVNIIGGTRYLPNRVMAAEVWAKDEQHAIKIVNEKRAEWIAMGKWEGA